MSLRSHSFGRFVVKKGKQNLVAPLYTSAMADTPVSVMLHSLRRAGTLAGAGLTDAQLLERFVTARDEAAFEVLVWRHSAMVLGLCRRVLRQEQDAEDAFQAAFLTLSRRAASISRGQAVGSWLFKVAYRIALAARKQSTVPHCPRKKASLGARHAHPGTAGRPRSAISPG